MITTASSALSLALERGKSWQTKNNNAMMWKNMWNYLTFSFLFFPFILLSYLSLTRFSTRKVEAKIGCTQPYQKEKWQLPLIDDTFPHFLFRASTVSLQHFFMQQRNLRKFVPQTSIFSFLLCSFKYVMHIISPAAYWNGTKEKQHYYYYHYYYANQFFLLTSTVFFGQPIT